jgi:type IV pilus assembly protein PilC
MLIVVTFVIPQFAEIYLKAGITLPTPTLIVYKAGIAIKHYWYLIAAAAIAILALARYYFKTERGSFLLDKFILKLPIMGPLYRKVAITRFARTLATLLASGVSILESLDIAKDVMGNEVLSRVISEARKGVEKGERMSEALRVSEEFPPDVVQMVAVGEETGSVDKMLEKIADFYDMTVNYAVKRLTAVIEPVFLVVMGVMVGCIMASMLLPMFDMVKTMRR